VLEGTEEMSSATNGTSVEDQRTFTDSFYAANFIESEEGVRSKAFRESLGWGAFLAS
jgi:hypothetical protein